MGAIHSTKIPTCPTGKSGPPQKVDQFFRNFSGWTGWTGNLGEDKTWSMGPLFGPGPWNTFLDRVHGPPVMDRVHGHFFKFLLACVAGVKRGRGNLGARGRKERNLSSLLPRAWSHALIPFPFPFERLPRRLNFY